MGWMSLWRNELQNEATKLPSCEYVTSGKTKMRILVDCQSHYVSYPIQV